MALIPPDAGIRMRLQNEVPQQTQPISPLPGVSVDLPELSLGQAFTARIQEVLPQNTYKALVAGKSVTLQMPEGAKAGDTLDLVVVNQTPRAIVAAVTGQSAAVTAAAGQTYPHATLSPAAQLIAELLLPEGETPKPAALNRGQPLLAQPPLRGSDLASALQKAVTESGVFYEAHQAQWVAGQRPLEQLLLEPQAQAQAQAQSSNPAALQRNDAAASAASDGQRANAERHANTPASPLQTFLGTENRAESAAAQSPSSMQLHAIPEALRPIVQQQLDAVATLRLVWHGEAWPNQPLEWEIVREDEQGQSDEADTDRTSWRTRLRLDTPRLGHVDASLLLTRDGIQMTIKTPDGTTAADLQTALPQLAAALDAAGIPLLGLAIKHEPAAG